MINRMERVELHCHTKMSEMDAVTDIADLIRCAHECGHQAVAITDTGVVQAFPDAAVVLKKYQTKYADFKLIFGMEGFMVEDMNSEEVPYHITILACDSTGLRNLYRLVTLSHMEYYREMPLIPRNVLREHREGLLIGSGCVFGEVYRSIMEKGISEAAERAAFYDYLEVQPPEDNAKIMENESGRLITEEDMRDVTEHIVSIGKGNGIPVVAIGNVHFLNPDDDSCRAVLRYANGHGIETQPSFYFRSTQEMLSCFDFLEQSTAEEIVVRNTQKIAAMCEKLEPVRSGKHLPKEKGADKLLKDICCCRLKELYGSKPPELVRERLDRELQMILENGYEVIYLTAMRLARKEKQDGYMIGSRGCVAGSFAAYLMGITNINPLPPHYRCPECKEVDFSVGAISDTGLAGPDLPDKICPCCGKKMHKDGFDIPWEPLMGLDGSKEPDIDLNIAGEEQAAIEEYMQEIFGRQNVFRPGTISTIFGPLADRYTDRFIEQQEVNNVRFDRAVLVKGITYVKQSSGLYPWGVMVLPDGLDIYDFTPLQHPANHAGSGMAVTHFDYHTLDEHFIKFDILGHPALSMLRMLQDLTEIDPREIETGDPNVLSLFSSCESLGISAEQLGGFELGTLGISGFFETDLVTRIIRKLKPKSVSDLIRISGLVHGTDVWIGNGEDLINNGIDFKDIICCRDDVMQYLQRSGVDHKRAFAIMEKVRKGKGFAFTSENETTMRKCKVPEWYIESCKKISYLFPKAHVAAYTDLAIRTAYYKRHAPLPFYAAYFSFCTKPDLYKSICFGEEHLEKCINELEADCKRTVHVDMEQTDRLMYRLHNMYVAREMYARGFAFAEYDPARADKDKFTIADGRLMPSGRFAGDQE